MVFVMFLKCFKNGGCQSGKHGSEAVVLWFMPILSGTMNAPPPAAPFMVRLLHFMTCRLGKRLPQYMQLGLMVLALCPQ